MNIAIDVLKLRRMRFDYVSPPICPPQISGSGSAMLVEAVDSAQAPANLRFVGQCDRFLTWTPAPGTLCTSLYRAQDPGNIAGAYVLVSECFAPGLIQVNSPGWWSITTTDSSGAESSRSTPVEGPAQIVIPTGCFVSFTLYKNPDPVNQAGTYYPVLTAPVSAPGVIEIMGDAGCYRLQAIAGVGVSNLSAPICRDTIPGCCPERPCSPEYVWDSDLCSCKPDTFDSITAPASDNFCVGVPYAGQFQAVGGTAPFTWSVVSGTTPPGIIFNSASTTGIAALSGIPTASGTFSLVVRATDAGGKSLQSSVTFVGLDPNQYSLFSGSFMVDVAFDKQLLSTGGTPPYAFVITAGALPPGLSMTSGGHITGTPYCPGVYPFEVTITDSLGVVCVVELSINISACPVVLTYPTIPRWGTSLDGHFGPQTNLSYAAFDASCNRTLWIPQSSYLTVAPFQVVSLVSTRTVSLAGYATDSSGAINTAAKGDRSNGMGQPVIDTKYNQCVVGGDQGYFSWYGLNSKDLLALTFIAHPPAGIYQFLQPRPAYDPGRGRIYMTQSTAGQLEVQVLDCGTRAVAGDYTHPGRLGGAGAYCPVNDTLYLVNAETYSGAREFHTWNPSTNVFTIDAPTAPLTSSPVSNIWFLPGINLIAVQNGNSVQFFDPTSANALIGTATNTGTVVDICYNSCNGLIYICSGAAGISRRDPANAFVFSATSFSTATHYASLNFDPASNRIFAVAQGSWQIDTGV